MSEERKKNEQRFIDAVKKADEDHEEVERQKADGERRKKELWPHYSGE